MNGERNNDNKTHNTNYEPQPISDFEQRLNGNPQGKKPRSKRKILIIIAIIVLVLAAASTVGAFYLLNDKTKTTSQTGIKTTDKAAVSSITPTEAVSVVKDYIKTKYPQVMPEGTKLSANQIYFKSSDSAPYWKIDGEKFYVNYYGDGASSLEVYYNEDSGNNEAIVARAKDINSAVIKSLATQGFVKSTDSVYGANQYSRIAYTKDDAVCIADSPENGAMSPPVSLACGQISKYTKDLENYKEIEPYAKAYAATGNMKNGDYFDFRELKAGKPGYKNASVGLSNAGTVVGGGMGLFYKTPASDDWSFFKGTQQILACKDYNTKDLQAAFAYENCYDSSKNGDASNNTVINYYQ